MTRRSHDALSGAVAAACLALCACGSAPVPATRGSAATSASRVGRFVLTGSFCDDVSLVMRQIPDPPPTAYATLAQARGNLGTVLRSSVQGFTALQAEAPARLRAPLRRIIGDYQADEKIVRTSGSVGQMSHSMVTRNLAASGAFRQVLLYISVRCR
jgi:hypothetical protein